VGSDFADSYYSTVSQGSEEAEVLFAEAVASGTGIGVFVLFVLFVLLVQRAAAVDLVVEPALHADLDGYPFSRRTKAAQSCSGMTLFRD
jgi:hypothetical protein